MNDVTVKTAEQLRQEAEQLIAQAQEQEREEKKRKDEAERALRRKADNDAAAAVATGLLAALKAAGVNAKFNPADVNGVNAWRNSVTVEPDERLSVEINVNHARYSDNRITGVSVVVGTYGERLTTYNALKPEELSYDKATANIVRRIESRKLDRERRAKEVKAQEDRNQVYRANQPVAERVRSARGDLYQVRVEPSGTKANHVSIGITSSIELSEEKAVEFVAGFKALLASIKE